MAKQIYVGLCPGGSGSLLPVDKTIYATVEYLPAILDVFDATDRCVVSFWESVSGELVPYALKHELMGCGAEINIGGTEYRVSEKIDAYCWSVLTDGGNLPGTTYELPTVVTSISHPMSALSDLATVAGDLVSLDVNVQVFVYSTGTPLTGTVNLAGLIGDATRRLNLKVTRKLKHGNKVYARQPRKGDQATWDDSYPTIDTSNDVSLLFITSSAAISIEDLQIRVRDYDGDTYALLLAGFVNVKRNIIVSERGLLSAGHDRNGLIVSNAVAGSQVCNNIIISNGSGTPAVSYGLRLVNCGSNLVATGNNIVGFTTAVKFDGTNDIGFRNNLITDCTTSYDVDGFNNTNTKNNFSNVAFAIGSDNVVSADRGIFLFQNAIGEQKYWDYRPATDPACVLKGAGFGDTSDFMGDFFREGTFRNSAMAGSKVTIGAYQDEDYPLSENGSGTYQQRWKAEDTVFTTLEDFESGWSLQSGSGGSVSYNTTTYKEGTKSLELTTPSGGTVIAEKDVTLDLSGVDFFRVFCHSLDFGTANQPPYFSAIIRCITSAGNYYDLRLNPTSYWPPNHYEKWTLFGMSKTEVSIEPDVIKTGSPDWANITKLEVRVTAGTGLVRTVRVDKLYGWENPINFGMCLCTLDDSSTSLDNHKELFTAYGYYPTIAVAWESLKETHDFGTGLDLQKGIGLTRIKEMQDTYGWPLISHSKLHPDFASLTVEEAREDLTWMRDYMTTNGLKHSEFFATPFGQHGDVSLDVMIEVHDFVRATYGASHKINLLPFERKWDFNGNFIISTSKPSTRWDIESITASTNTIQTSSNHGLKTGQPVYIQLYETETLAGINRLFRYYLIEDSANTFKLATSMANALAGTELNLTADVITTGKLNSYYETSIGRLRQQPEIAFSSSVIADDTLTLTTDNTSNYYTLAQGSVVYLELESGVDSGGLINNRIYYVESIPDTTSIRLATNIANILSGTYVNITADVGPGYLRKINYWKHINNSYPPAYRRIIDKAVDAKAVAMLAGHAIDKEPHFYGRNFDIPYRDMLTCLDYAHDLEEAGKLHMFTRFSELFTIVGALSSRKKSFLYPTFNFGV